MMGAGSPWPMHMTMAFLLQTCNWMVLICVCSMGLNMYLTDAAGRITEIDPQYGSHQGGTLLTIRGEGFSEDQFNFNDPTKGNRVVMIHTKTGRILGCDIIQTETNSYGIKCETRPSPTGDADYQVKIKVDGIWLNNDKSGTYCGWNCKFKYRSFSTPMLTGIQPKAGLPGDIVTMIGRFYTLQISRLSLEYNADKPEINKMFVGPEICEPFNIDNELIGAKRDCDRTWCFGWVKCRPITKIAGSWNASSIISQYGRTKRDPQIYLVDHNDESYIYQTYADVTNVSPKEGSKAGGTTVTIKGRFFSDNKNLVSAKVDGVTCEVLSSSKDTITCKTGTEPVHAANVSDYYPGARGLHLDYWKRSGVQSLSDFDKFDKTSSSYSSLVMREVADLQKKNWPNMEGTHGILSGFFIPPHTGNYSFFIMTDDVGYLYMSDSQSKAEKKQIAHCPSYSGWKWNKFPQQRSEKRNLIKDQPYYLEMKFLDYGGGYYARLGFQMDSTQRTHAQVKSAIDEKQVISISSIYKWEKQVLSVINSSEQFHLTLDGRTSSAIQPNFTASQLESTLHDLFSTKCTFTLDPKNAYFFQNYEDTKQGVEYGVRLSNNVPYCGRKSLKLDQNRFIFKAGETRKKGSKNGIILKHYDARKYGRLCFAYKGPFENKVKFFIYYYDKSNVKRSYYPTFSFVLGNNHLTKWNWACINILQELKGYLTEERAVASKGFYVQYIQMRIAGRGDMFVDNIWIGKQDLMVSTRIPGAQLNGAVIEDIKVNSSGNSSWEIDLKPVDCVFNLPFFKVHNATLRTATSSKVTYELASNDGNQSLITIEKMQHTSPPATGTFDIKYNAKILEGIAADISADDLKETLQDTFQTGELNVIKGGTCLGNSWTIQFIGIGGNKEQLAVYGDSLRGDNVSVKATTSEDGGLFMGPAPMEFFRVPEIKRQVVVTVNELVASCIDQQCSFEYTDQQTPQIYSVSPSSGHGGSGGSGTAVTIAGSGFSNTTINNIVTINGVICQVSSSNSSSISCNAGYSQAGLHEVKVMVKGKGYAAHQRGKHTFRYTMAIHSIQPSKGSTSGGTIVSIKGSGFGSVVKDCIVLLRNLECEVTFANMSNIICITPAHAMQTVSLNVSIKGASAQLVNAFEYNSNLTPVINSITAGSLSVIGDEQITMDGTGLASLTGGPVTVTVSGKACRISSSSNTKIVCSSPKHTPGNKILKLSIPGKGYAKFTTSPNVTYVLVVRSITPERGSVMGGTVVKITGDGFSSAVSDNKVTVGGKPCAVMSSSNTVIQCLTPGAGKTIKIDNSGRDEEFGVGYAWSLRRVEINIGDSIEWSWTSLPLSGLTIGVYRTKCDSTTFDGNGFNSLRGSSGQFKYRYLRKGESCFSSGFVDKSNTVKFKQGKVIVGKLKQSVAGVIVKVNGTEAVYDKSSPASSSTGSCDSGVETPVSNCSQTKISSASSEVFTFFYYTCSTPRITSVSPSWITANDHVIISGYGFSSMSCHNKVKLGEHVCDVLLSNETQITCKINITGNPPINTYLTVSVQVLNRGNGLLEADNSDNVKVKVSPHVDSMSPQTGSVAGGTVLTLLGTGFNSGLVTATIKCSTIKCTTAIKCNIMTLTYTKIVCVTAKSLSNLPSIMNLQVNGRSAQCKMTGNTSSACDYTYLTSNTPMITSISPTVVASEVETITVTGNGFGADNSKVNISIGPTSCPVSTVNDTMVTCVLRGLLAGDHLLVLNVDPKGNALISGTGTIKSQSSISSLQPERGSSHGGTAITITGNGFDPAPGQVTVSIGSKECTVKSVTYSTVTCTSPAGSASQSLILESRSERFTAKTYIYDTSVTPTVTSISPTTGHGGQSVTISGSAFHAITDFINVRIGGIICTVSSTSNTSITCTLGARPAGTVPVLVHIKGKGCSNSDATFEYELAISSTSPSQSGYGGGINMTVNGYGFGNDTIVNICDKVCPVISVTDTMLICETPSYPNRTLGNDVACSVSVKSPSHVTKTLSNSYTYKNSLTSTVTLVSPSRGGTGGGVRVYLTGTGFDASQGSTVVTLAGVPCAVTHVTSTNIECVTGPSSKTIKTDIRVDVGSKGKALVSNGTFYYVDVWSSKFTWGGKDPPVAGDFVTIKKGQTMLVDINTPVLSLLLIKGGTLMFDEKDLELHAGNILITEGGQFLVGESPEKPFQHKAIITLHGHVRSTELPIYGAKSLSVREGFLGLYGKFIPYTWTFLKETANVGDTSIKLKQAVIGWSPGDEIVIAATGKSIRENEVVNITAVTDGGNTIQFTPPLKYRHISIQQTFQGRVIETRAEVGLLTRNIVVQGNEEKSWIHKVKNCDKEFEPGQFKTQTCFDGRFGEERGSDQFGVQIMLHSGQKNSRKAMGHFHYTEVRHCGQAFRIGRYPIHFHMDGDVYGSYVKGCAIHHSFNRAVTMHGVHNLVVEHTVIYDILGNAFFMESGIETGNVVRYNLGIFVKPSSSTLNVDITPAAYWVTNANNTVTDNAAAGGSHFGFWYQMFAHPDGPSFTKTVCPRNVPLLEFKNNTAHTFGRYGLWIFPIFHPKKGGGCSAEEAQPAEFESLTSWNNMRGAEVDVGGAVRFRNNVLLDNDIAGIEFIEAVAPWGGPMVVDSLIVGQSVLQTYNVLKISSHRQCTEAGIRLPKTSRLTVSNVRFINFNNTGCHALRACAHCSFFGLRGGWPTRFEKLTFVNSPKRAKFDWIHQAYYEDLDGSLTGYSGGTLVPYSAILDPSMCTRSESFSDGVPTAICKSGVSFKRMSWNHIKPSSIEPKDAFLSNRHGTTFTQFKKKGTTHPKGWTAIVPTKDNITLGYKNAAQFTNISYDLGVYEMLPTDWFYLRHQLKQVPDFFTTTGRIVNGSDILPNPSSQTHGDWNFNDDTKQLTILMRGSTRSSVTSKNPPAMSIHLKVYRCYFLKCVVPTPPPPPKGRPVSARYWSKNADWSGAPAGYGGADGRLPKENDNVMVVSSWWMVADLTYPSRFPKLDRLYIYGTLELENGHDHHLSANIIFISGLYGNLIVGWPDRPMPNNVIISLRGNWDSKDMPLNNGPTLGSKAIGVFGRLQMIGEPRSIYWTRLSKTANAGDTFIDLVVAVDWKKHEEILISSTSYQPTEAEKFTIASVENDKKRIRLSGALQYKHLGTNHTIGGRHVPMQAKVALLTRNIRIEGDDDPEGAIGAQSFGARVLVGRYLDSGITYSGKAQIQNVQFKHCGQNGWNEPYDPRYALSYLDVGTIAGNESFVKNCAFHDGFNTGIGVFGTHSLLVENNVIHHVIGAGIRVQGNDHVILKNLVVYVIAPDTYKNLKPHYDIHWPGGIEVVLAQRVTLRGNVVSGSEKIGFMIGGEDCHVTNSATSWSNNEAHSCLHGVHVPIKHRYIGCLRITGFYSWKNWDFGIYAYPNTPIIVTDTIVADSGNGMALFVHSPPSMSHRRVDKYIEVRNSLIIGVSPSFDCSLDQRKPMPATFIGFRAPRPSSGAMAGILMPLFSSGPPAAPLKPWHVPMNYPAISGITRISGTTFSNFVDACGKKHVAMATNRDYGDIFHPIEMKDTRLINVTEANILKVHVPTTGFINPSDCVDMDCDALRKVLIKDRDGTMFGKIAGSIISKSEYQWNGKPAFGLGDYRIPKTMITNKDGSKINPDTKYPNKGIVRGSKTTSSCTFRSDWNVYQCTDLDYYMFIIESLDIDTETRRLSPVALASDGYIDLINGPQDHGWCFGYTCQERISTFNAMVAVKKSYELHFTSYNPQKTRFHLLSSKETDAIVVATYFAKPQRMDVYRKGVYILPTNARMKGQSFEIISKDPTKPDDQYVPTINGNPGLNYFDSDQKLLYIVVKGPEPIDIRITAVIQLKMGVSFKDITVDDFFKENIINNLAALLNIDKSRIRIMNVISAGGRRKRRTAGKDLSEIDIEIGDPPKETISVQKPNVTTTQTPTTSKNITGNSTNISFKELERLATTVIEKSQTGELSKSLGIKLNDIKVVEPEPEPVDPTGGARATNETVQIVNATNGTLTYDEKMALKTQQTNIAVDYLIPAKLLLVTQPSGSNETMSLLSQPQLRMYDALNRWVSNLGRADALWRVTASLVNVDGDSDARLDGKSTVSFINGTANFTNIAVTHNGRYRIRFNVTYPSAVRFSVESNVIEIKERQLYFTLTQQPAGANETVSFSQQPQIEVRDAANNELVNNTGWKGRKWIFVATLIQNGNNNSFLNGSTTVEFIGPYGIFTNLSIDTPGNNYQLQLVAETKPSSRYTASFTSNSFNVKERELYLYIAQQPGDCNDTVICGNQPILEVRSRYPDALAGNLGWKGHKWYISASMYSGGNNRVINGEIFLQIPRSGRAVFTDLSFNNSALAYQFIFNVILHPLNSRYENMTIISNSFDVKERQFYLAAITSPGNANDSIRFGKQPVIEVRDLGTGLAGRPLKKYWNIATKITIGNGTLLGTKTVDVVQEKASYADLSITGYGVGFVLLFESNYGHQFYSHPFDVRFHNDYYPVFNQSTPATINIYENATIGTTLHTFRATDKDSGIAGMIKYLLMTNQLSWLFHLSESTGDFKFASSPDRENASSYAVVIRAVDRAPSPFELSRDHRVLVNILDVNDNLPKFSWPILNITVPETVVVGQVAFSAIAEDLDEGENARLTYAVLWTNDTGTFQLNASSGAFHAKVSLDLDSTEAEEPVFMYVLNVHDNGIDIQHSANVTIYIRIVRVNEYSPLITSPGKSLNIVENIAIGTVLYQMNATDADSGKDGRIAYNITSGDPNEVFSINSNGYFSVQKNIDREKYSGFTLTLSASDAAPIETRRQSSISVIIAVLDLNDNVPTFTKSSYSFVVLDNIAVDSQAGFVTASDPDDGANGQVEYSIVSSNNNGSSLFRISKSGGSILTKQSLDLDSLGLVSKQILLTILAKDKGTPQSLNSTVNVTLTIIGVNEYSPVLTHSSDIIMQLSSNIVGSAVIDINATDQDFGPDGNLIFSISQGNEDGDFFINGTTGLIVLSKTPLRPHYLLDISVTDSAIVTSSRKSTTAKVTIYNPDAPNGTDIGAVYVGSNKGTSSFAVTSGQIVTMPIYINCGMQQIEGFDISVDFDSTALRFENGLSYFHFEPSVGSVRIVGVVEYNKTYLGIPKVADLTFVARKSVTCTPRGKKNNLVDIYMNPIPSASPTPATPCTRIIMGDINKDCKFDIADAALIQTYTRESSKGFTSPVGHQLLIELTNAQITSMDVNKNGETDYSDAVFLSKVIIGHAKYISSITVAKPDSKAISKICSFTITVSLKDTDGTPATNVRIFAILSNADPRFIDELKTSDIPSKAPYIISGGSHRYGQITELNVSNTAGNFALSATKSTISKQNVGITLIQAVHMANGKTIVTSTYRHPIDSTEERNVVVEAGIQFGVSSSYKPQLVVNFTETSSICADPPKKQRMRLVFPFNYDDIVKGKESRFILTFTTFIESQYSTPSRNVKASNITVRMGSILIDFDFETKQSKYKSLVDAIVSDINNGLIFTFDTNKLKAMKSLMLNGEELIRPPSRKPDDDKRVVIIAIVVSIFVLLALLSITFLICRRKRKHGKEKETEVLELRTITSSKANLLRESTITSSKANLLQESPSQVTIGLQNPIYSSNEMLGKSSLSIKESACIDPIPAYDGPEITALVYLADVSQDEQNLSSSTACLRDAETFSRPSSAQLPNDGRPRSTSLRKRRSSSFKAHDKRPGTGGSRESEGSQRDIRPDSPFQEANLPGSNVSVIEPGSPKYNKQSCAQAPGIGFRMMYIKQLRENCFHNIGEVQVDLKGTLEELRSVIRQSNSNVSKQTYVFLTPDINVIHPKTEKSTTVKDIFTDAVRIKIISGTGSAAVEQLHL